MLRKNSLSAVSLDWRPRLAALALASTAAPTVTGVSPTLPVGGGAIFYSDIALIGALACCARPALFSRIFSVWVSVVIVTAGLALLGTADGATLRWIARDLRPPAYFAVGLALGAYIRSRPLAAFWIVKMTAWLLAIVACLVVVSQVVPIVGNVDSLNVVDFGAGSIELASRRTQIETNAVALCILSGLVGAGLAGAPLGKTMGRRYLWAIVISCAVILFLSYSRNTLFGIGVAALFGASFGAWRVSSLRLIRAGGATMAVVVAVGSSIALASSFGLFSNQISAFRERVLGGLTGEAISVDPGVRWRERESNLAVSSFARSPVIGRGLGVFYRPHVSGEAIQEEGGRLYVHNFYLWVLVKGGVLTLLLLLAATAVSMSYLVRNPVARPISFAVGAGVLGLLTCGFVAPWPVERNCAAIYGAAVGAGLSLRSGKIRKPSTRSVPDVGGRA